MTESITTGQVAVTVALPVQYRAIREGTSTATFDIKVAGMNSIFDLLPQEVKVAIAEAVALHAAV